MTKTEGPLRAACRFSRPHLWWLLVRHSQTEAALKALDVDALSPRDALDLLYDLKIKNWEKRRDLMARRSVFKRGG